ncbi:disease resistance protein RML1A-like isoform X2 [Lotus japonicus]|uniref:disease resistance protein RML1A-like isoform X2 n=1 Tax=Lotus japonicus TaxID=34305 RepID=UPI00258973DE|nr:disease resistance protein RML1A-like isoform X2 [Lotus japonicus]
MANQQIVNSVSSSSSVVSLKKYDVFLSFRGEDTRNNFTSHLHDALTRKKVETYIDYRLEKGDEISQALIKAIQDSLVSVVIFSENYASSKWCLDEITKILECKRDHGQIVIPVFYKVDPSHVRNQRESYKEAFAKHEQDLKNSDDKLQKWRCALTEAANLAGWDSRVYRNETEFIKDIIEDVLQKLNIRYPIELKGVIGIERNYTGVESLLEIGSREVRIIGIWGMGGIGKTTLALALHAKLYSQFEGHCFLASVREKSEKFGVDVLRNRLFSELLEEENLRVVAPKVESHFVSRRLRRKKVLIVLDDVATSEQLEDLISDYDCLAPGSRVIVTTRDKHIFSQVNGIYEVKELNNHDSLQLFCLNAFREKQPEIGYEELSESVIAYCKGNPLALKVLGARLRSRSREAWKSEVRKLQKIPDVKIHNVLKLSFEDLDRTEKDIFLDIACFFKGEYRDHVTSLLDACDFFAAIGIEVLLDKSLITLSNKDTIEMHDLLQEMGWEIVHQESIKDPGRRSRLWDPEEVYDVLKYGRGTEAVEGIILDVSKIKDLQLSYDSFTKMTNIRFIKFHYGQWNGRCKLYIPDGLKSLSNKLRYLEWHGYSLESLPSTFCAKLLVELSMPYSNLEKLWDGVQNLVNLKEIDLRFCKDLVEVPDLSMATNLEELSLAQCKSLRRIHPSILSLHKLQDLDLEGCTEIEGLQTDVHLKSLRNIRLSNCSSLKEFSVFSEPLERLWLDGTGIQEFPSSLWHCEKLSFITLQGCDSLDNFGNKLSYEAGMKSINYLELSGCKQLNASNLCFILNGLHSLKDLSLEDCCNLKSLPDNIGLLSSLHKLHLSRSNVESLSTNIKNLLMLKELKLDNCKKLVHLPELPPSLQVLSAVNCTSLVVNFTQLLRSFSLKHGPEEHRKHVFLPGNRVPEWFSFHAEGASVTIPYLPLSGLCGFIWCFILSQSPTDGKYGYVECYIYKNSKRVDGKGTFLGDQNLITDHVFLWYTDIIKGGVKHSMQKVLEESIACDPYDISFKFSHEDEEGEWSMKGIKGCGVCPIYASGNSYSFQQEGLEFEFGNSSVDTVELEPNSSNYIDELQHRATGFEVKGANHNNEKDLTKKLQDVMHQTIITEDREYHEEGKGTKGKQKLLVEETNVVYLTKSSIEKTEVHQRHASSSSTLSIDAGFNPSNNNNTTETILEVSVSSVHVPPTNADPLEITPTEECATFRDIGAIKKRHIPLLEEAIANYPSLWSWRVKFTRSKMREFGYTILGDMLEFLSVTRWGDLTETKKAEFESLVCELETFGFDIQWLKNTETLIKQSKIDKVAIDHMKRLEVQVKEQQTVVEELEDHLQVAKVELTNLKSELGNLRCELGNLDDFIGF